MNKINIGLKRPGIYCIINIKNNSRYIGSSKNIFQRLSCHRSYLRKNCHQNIILQNSWNKYGEENFDFYVLEFCDIDQLIVREQFYIDSLNSEFNITKVVERNELSKESRKKQSKTRIEKIKSGEILISSRKIFKYDLNGNYICEYKSVRDASKDSNISVSSINRFTSGKYKKAGNFLWSYDFVEKMNPYTRSHKKYSPKNKKKVFLLDYYSKALIKEFESIAECAVFFETYRENILYAIKKKRKYKDKYMVTF